LQRSYPAPRDYYDIWKLLQEQAVMDNWDLIVETFQQKAAFKHIAFNDYSDFFNDEQIRKMKQAWNNSLQAHLREDDFPDVNQVLNDLESFFSKMDWR